MLSFLFFTGVLAAFMGCVVAFVANVDELHYVRNRTPTKKDETQPFSNLRMDQGFYNKLLATHNMRCLADRAEKRLNDIAWKNSQTLDAIVEMRKLHTYARTKLAKYVRKTANHPLGILVRNISGSKTYSSFGKRELLAI